MFINFLLCQIVSIRKFHKNRTRFMRLRMMHFKAMTKKMGQMELGLFEDAKFIAALGDFAACFNHRKPVWKAFIPGGLRWAVTSY